MDTNIHIGIFLLICYCIITIKASNRAYIMRFVNESFTLARGVWFTCTEDMSREEQRAYYVEFWYGDDPDTCTYWLYRRQGDSPWPDDFGITLEKTNRTHRSAWQLHRYLYTDWKERENGALRVDVSSTTIKLFLSEGEHDWHLEEGGFLRLYGGTAAGAFSVRLDQSNSVSSLTTEIADTTYFTTQQHTAALTVEILTSPSMHQSVQPPENSSDEESNDKVEIITIVSSVGTVVTVLIIVLIVLAVVILMRQRKTNIARKANENINTGSSNQKVADIAVGTSKHSAPTFQNETGYEQLKPPSGYINVVSDNAGMLDNVGTSKHSAQTFQNETGYEQLKTPSGYINVVSDNAEPRNADNDNGNTYDYITY